MLEFLPLLRNLTDQLYLLTNGPSSLSETERRWLQQYQIGLVETPLKKLGHEQGYLHTVYFQDGTTIPLDALYVRVGFRQSATAAMPRTPMPSPRRSGGTHTPWTWAADGLAQATSALNTSRPWSKAAKDQPRETSWLTRVR